MTTTILSHPLTRILSLMVALLALGGCSLSGFETEPVPTLYAIPSLTPLPPTATPQPIGESPAQTTVDDASNSPAVPTAPPCAETEGHMSSGTYVSHIAEQDVDYLIYLPPCYESSGKRYPVLYMLHGLGAGMDYTQWDRLGLPEAADAGYQRGTLAPMIIVMPNGAVYLPDGFLAHGRDYFSPTNSYEYMILDELMPAIESGYCTWNERQGRAIGGLSRGGFWAYEIGLRHPELFSSIGGHSAALYEDADYPIPPANDPLQLARDAQGIEDVRMYLDHGSQDYDWLEEAVALFSARLDARGIEHTYVVNPVGGHNEDYWASHTAEYLNFYAAQWPTDVEQLPPCAVVPG